MRRLLLLVPLLLTAAPALAANEAPAPAPPTAADLSAAREAARAAETKAAILEARNQLADKGVANLALVVGELGVVMTLAVLFFGAASVVSAGRAARGEIRDARDEIDALRRQADVARQQAENAGRAAATAQSDSEAAAANVASLRRQAAVIVDEINTSKAKVEEDAKGVADTRRRVDELAAGLLPGQTTKLSVSESADVARAAAAVDATPKAVRTAGDYRVLILDAGVKEDWAAVLTLVGEMIALPGLSDVDTAWALFAEGFAREKGSDRGAALASSLVPYGTVIARFGDDADPDIRFLVAAAMFNRANNLAELDRMDEALAGYDALIARFGDSSDPALLEQVAKAMVNKGVRLAALGRSDDAIAGFDAVVARFAASDTPALHEQAVSARYNAACTAALRGDAADAVGRLRAWRGTADDPCGKIAADHDFDTVRADPAFVAFLAEIGCPPTPPAA